ncbi:serine/threonine-protein phosphatase 7 long form-like protein [Cucumis melo var. makuwa]|uniref:Serine/threonine-protein phosphatase 7 long form-like protein n=1 Tax=Cucumis melo var. makuwa TaxID=1194695 RepID=A0A5D3DGI7_CUCMM|nr:serine/threonine-protein phosphatase 7 long form-like protein [Cucumis melo var. makuwa]TYK22817.1 serine/threonine-protein phosphatase 7 long form-like protein [Cucumis melo var. makuwa]
MESGSAIQLYQQPSHRSQFIWDTSFIMVLSCQRKEAKSQRTIPFDQRIVPYLKAARFLGDSSIGLAPHYCFSIALETGDPYISYALWEMHHHVAGHYDSVGIVGERGVCCGIINV